MTSPNPRSVTLTIAEVIAETAEACSLVFEIPPEHTDRFAYRPGQFLTLRVPSERTGSVARCYSLSSSPHTDTRLQVTVKRTPDGYGSNWLCTNVKPGDTLEVLPPSGVFTPRSLDENLLLLAAGSGITPIISITKSTLAAGSGNIVLFYANRDADTVIFATRLRELVKCYGKRLTVIEWLESERGLPSADGLTELLRPYRDHRALLCGPTAFLDVSHDTLNQLDVPRSRVHTEVFTSLRADPFHNDQPVQEQSPDLEGTATVEVELDGNVHRLQWPRYRNLVELLLAADIDVPHSCREGECGACMCTLVDGEVTMDNPDLLDPGDIEDGYILGCQAHPISDYLRITY